MCYAYLSDVKSSERSSIASAFMTSKWFTRGWTLQELLAPQYLEFLDSEWNELGTKGSLGSLVKAATGITHLFDFQEASVAQRMSWAANRETTRIEDQAYSLMGIFDVHMPLLYGEGSNAFIRLQHEILNKSDDESIFVWNDESKDNTGGLLATSPKFFSDSGSVRMYQWDIDRPPYNMTNKGLRLEVYLTNNFKQTDFIHGHAEVLAPLNCIW